MPGDVISVSKADLVYAVGSVKKPGGFLIGQNSSLTTLQVVSLAEGLEKTAAGDKAKILRVVPGSSTRAEIAVTLKQLMAGRGADLPLQPDDILFIPIYSEQRSQERFVSDTRRGGKPGHWHGCLRKVLRRWKTLAAVYSIFTETIWEYDFPDFPATTGSMARTFVSSSMIPTWSQR